MLGPSLGVAAVAVGPVGRSATVQNTAPWSRRRRSTWGSARIVVSGHACMSTIACEPQALVPSTTESSTSRADLVSIQSDEVGTGGRGLRGRGHEGLWLTGN